MANVNDYLTWRGDLKISTAHPFNDVDGMILARFSYLVFNKIALESRETVGSIAEKMSKLKNSEFRWNGDKQMITLMGQSRRFRKMRVTDFVEEHDETAEKQFAAITIHIDYHEVYISFLGTDETIVGWKEDFNMAFLEKVPAQEDGLKYFQMIVKKYPLRRFRLGGHSKGGNVAIYTAIMLSDRWQKRLIKVYNFDGPGLSKRLMAKDLGWSVLPKIQSFIPQDSVVGRLLEHAEDYEVVKSLAKSLYQHDIFSWQVSRTGLVPSTLTEESNTINTAITRWLENATLEQRRIFVDGLFKILTEGKAKRVDEIMKNWPKYIPAFIKSFSGISKEERKVILDSLKELGGSYVKVKRRKAKKKAEEKKKIEEKKEQEKIKKAKAKPKKEQVPKKSEKPKKKSAKT